MCKRLLVSIFSLVSIVSFAQTPTLQQKLYYTCKVWGFVKYYHSNVSNCSVNWDSVLISVLPVVENAANDSEFNDALDTMLAAAGPMQLSTTYFPDTLPAFLKYDRNWGWTDNSMFRTDVQTQLDTIKNNFRPHNSCWVTINSNPAFVSGGYLLFPPDEPLLNINTSTNYPDKYHRLLMMFKYWNIINYFNPNNYVIDKPIDTVLNSNIMNFDTASNGNSLYSAIEKITSALDDAHVEDLTYSTYQDRYIPEIMLKYLQGKYTVVKSAVPPVAIGDVILSVNNVTTTQWEDSLINYTSAGNEAIFRSFMCQFLLLQGTEGTSVNITYADTLGNINTTTLTRNVTLGNSFFPASYYPADSLSYINWTTMNCGIGYINLNNLTVTGADSAYASLQNAPAIIIDIRKANGSGAIELADLMFPNPRIEAKYTAPDITYPGTFSWNYPDTIGITNNPTPYNGTVILLFNEQTQSHAETYCMLFSTLPHVIKIGSQTAGADGDITDFQMSQDIETGYTSLGWYYPNGDSVQRIGIVPDSVVEPTIRGIMQGRDEVLEKALTTAGCNLHVQNIAPISPSIKVYPNPVSDIITVEGTNIGATDITINITDVTGRILFQKTIENNNGDVLTHFDIKTLSAGMYMVTVKADGQQYVTKIVKE